MASSILSSLNTSLDNLETQVLSFGVERGAFTKSEASAKAFDMVLTFNFN